jgi:hypothetical protein
MAEGLVAQILGDVEHLVVKAAQDMFGTGGGTGKVDGIRWEGMSNAQLAAAVHQLSSGPGASAIQQAADALSTIAGNLQEIDNTLRGQLSAIGINWQSTAGELAQEMTTASAAYSASAGAAGGANAAAMGAQGDAYSAARNAVPHPSTLTQPAGFPATGGGSLTGHSNDQAKQVAATNQARQQAIDTMTNYTTSSQSGLRGYQTMPQPPAFTLAPQPVDPGLSQVTTVSGFEPGPSGVPGTGDSGFGGFSGGGSPGGTGGTPGLPGFPGSTSVGAPGTALGVPGQAPPMTGFPGSPGGGVPGLPGGGGGLPPGLPGAPGGGGPIGGAPVGGGGPGVVGPLGPGPVSGIGGGAASAGSASGISSAAASGAVSGALVEDTAIGGAIVGGAAAAGIGGASARQDELVRSRQLGDGEPEGGDARSQAARALAELEGDEAVEAQVSERIGATAEPAPTLLEPIMGRRGDDDEEHSNRYAGDDDMFDDGRMVVPPVLGGESDDPK